MKKTVEESVMVVERLLGLKPQDLITTIQEKIREILQVHPETDPEELYLYSLDLDEGRDASLYISFPRYETELEEEFRLKEEKARHNQFMRSVRAACRNYPDEMRKILSEEL